jgi:hypothetical protein
MYRFINMCVCVVRGLVDYEALAMLLREREDLKAIVECIGDGVPLSAVIDCVVAKGIAIGIHGIRYRIRYLAQYRAVEVLRIGRRTYLRLDKDFAKYIKKAERKTRKRGAEESKS